MLQSKRLFKVLKTIYEHVMDCKEYIKWEYNNKCVTTKNAFEAKILRQTHVIEKGMSLSNPRAKFGVQRVLELFSFIDEFVACGYKVDDSTVVKNSLGVIEAYLDFHRERGFVPNEIVSKLEAFNDYTPNTEVSKYGIEEISLNDMQKLINSEFPVFIKSRHSVRQFSDKKIDPKDIKRSVSLAMSAPSACNRQSCKAYFYTDSKTNDDLSKAIIGNTGFSNEAQNYIVVTSDISAFYDAPERNQMYVDAGIFTMALIEALHYYGIASCVLQNGETSKTNRIFKNICTNIPENEKIVLFIAVGYYKDPVVFATSHRKQLEDVLIVK